MLPGPVPGPPFQKRLHRRGRKSKAAPIGAKSRACHRTPAATGGEILAMRLRRGNQYRCRSMLSPANGRLVPLVSHHGAAHHRLLGRMPCAAGRSRSRCRNPGTADMHNMPQGSLASSWHGFDSGPGPVHTGGWTPKTVMIHRGAIQSHASVHQPAPEHSLRPDRAHPSHVLRCVPTPRQGSSQRTLPGVIVAAPGGRAESARAFLTVSLDPTSSRAAC